MKLVIAEKPSVGKSIAKVLKATKKDNAFMEGNGYVVSWCIGHLCDLANTEVYDPRYEVWRYDDIPIIPQKWEYRVYQDKKAQFDVLKNLMNRNDVDEIINACDSGREGERIFRNVYKYAGCKKPVKRLWISSMEDKAILEGFNNLKPCEDFDNLYMSAECRAKADWLIGINFTRLLSTLYHRTLNCGRVMSPTLNFIVERDEEIKSFKPEPYWNIKLKCDGFSPISDKITSKEIADVISIECSGQNAECVELTSEEKHECPPKLYDLTSLQRDANRILGLTAQETLECVQSLYEKKLCTYPRTDSKYLTDDMYDTALKLLKISAEYLDFDNVPENVNRVCDTSKVTDHFAIVPTEYSKSYDIGSLPAKEKEIYNLIARRLLAACSTDYIYSSETTYFQCGRNYFKYKYRRIIDRGWKAYIKDFKSDSDEEETDMIFEKGKIYPVTEIERRESYTKSKPPFTEDTLLSAMEKASVNEMPDDAERKGLGTPATRASTIEKLVKSGFVVREKGKLIPTNTGISLMKVIPENLKSASLTAEWENRLKEIENGKTNSNDFMLDILSLVCETTENYIPIKDDGSLFPSGRRIVGKCPRCGGNVSESSKGYFCEANDCRFGIWNDNKFLIPREISINDKNIGALLDDGKVAVNKIKSVKTGNYYPGILIMDDNGQTTHFRIELNKNA